MLVEDVVQDRAKPTEEFGAVGCGSHIIYWNGIPTTHSEKVKYLVILLAGFE